MQLPSSTILIGLRIHLQGWAVAPGQNAANLTVSDGLEWVVGSM